MSFHPRRILPPGASKKRKEGEAFYNPAPIPNKRATTNPNPNPNPNLSPSHSFKTPLADFPSAPDQAKGKKSPDNPAIDNRLLAGYMAYEFLTRGTIVGQRFDPTQAEAEAVAVAVAVEPRRKPVVAEQSQSHQRKGKEKEKEKEKEKKEAAKQHPSYADVASMLMTDGAHIPGVVNPSQLVRWLHQ